MHRQGAYIGDEALQALDKSLPEDGLLWRWTAWAEEGCARTFAGRQTDDEDLAKADEYANLIHRQLSVATSESGVVEAIVSSFYRVMKEGSLMEKRQLLLTN